MGNRPVEGSFCLLETLTLLDASAAAGSLWDPQVKKFIFYTDYKGVINFKRMRPCHKDPEASLKWLLLAKSGTNLRINIV
jgi:hypothetical protein